MRSRTERPRLEQSVSDAVVDVGRYSSRDSDGKNSFTYGNGIVHTLTQNARGLPERSRDALGATAVHDDTYDYDFNGNVAAITDGLPGQYGDRDMTYDALDRLTSVDAAAAQGGDATFAYDPLDNIRVLDQGARQYRYSYSATTNQLSTIKNPAGSTLFTFGHDIRGNQTARTGATFTWDRADRMTATSLGTSSYVYDGLGRRVKATAGGLATDSYYGRDGALVFQRTPTKTVNYIRLAGSLVAERSVPIGGGGETRTFQHTDALGTPVLETNASGAEITGSRERMTAYGEPADGGYADGPGYTGHVTDAASKLTYMQQRYYDPMVGRFLSVDPVTELTNGDMRHFNRYAYAYNSPYGFTDPDGRCGACDGFGDQYADDAAAGNLDDYDAFVGPAVAVTTAALPGGPLLRLAAKEGLARLRPEGVPKTWTAEKPSSGPGAIYRNPQNLKHDTVRVVPGRPGSSQPGQKVTHVVRTANGRRYGQNNTVVPTKSQESHVPVDKFKFVPADKLPKN